MPDNNPIKAAAQTGLGLIQDIQAHKLKNDANSAAPPLIDPTQAGFLSELNQKRNSLDAGTAFASGINNINATNAGTNEGLVRAGGGDVNGTIQALLQSQRATNDSKNQLFGQGQSEQNFNTTMYGDLLNKVAARKMQLQLQQSQQLRAEWAAKKQAANQNMMAGASGLTGTDFKTPAPAASTKPVSSTDTFSDAGDGPANTGGMPPMPGMGAEAGGAEAGLGDAAELAVLA